MEIATAWQCENLCNVFETVGVPNQCPHCGATELYQHGESLREYTVFENEATQ